MSEQREAAKKTLEEQAERVKDSTDRNNKRMYESRPTPTQEEVNLTALGVGLLTHEDDGSGPEPTREFAFKQIEAKPGSGASYQTRAAVHRSRSE